MIVQLDKPYPVVEISTYNIDDAKKVLESYSGEVSENTAIHSYLYQSFSLRDQYPKYAEIIKQIAIVEMRHLNLLAQVILKYGLAPAFVYPKDAMLKGWDTNQLNYTVNLNDLLALDIESEIGAIEGYRTLIQTLENESVKKLLYRIIEDEEIHLSIFRQLKEELKNNII